MGDVAIIGQSSIDNKFSDEKDNTVTKVVKEMHVSPILKNSNALSPEKTRIAKSIDNGNVLDLISRYSINKLKASPIRSRMSL